MSSSIPAMDGGTDEPSGMGQSAPSAAQAAQVSASGSRSASVQPSQAPQAPRQQVSGAPQRQGLFQAHPILSIVGALLILALGLAVGFAAGHGIASNDIEQTTIDTISSVDPSVVQVQGQSSGVSAGGSVGSGEVLTASGYVVTNSHVVHGFSRLSALLSTGQTVSAQLIVDIPSQDLAVLKLNASNLKPIQVADSSKARVGQYAIAMGSPLGLEQSATTGIVSALNREATEVVNGQQFTLTGMIQTSAPINPGNSGGALVNRQGQLVGIPTLAAVDPSTRVAANGIGFAISSNKMEQVIGRYIPSNA